MAEHPCDCGCGNLTRGRYLRGHSPVVPQFRPCACGCGTRTRGEYAMGHRPSKTMATPCMCGCGVRTNGEYLRGHQPSEMCIRCMRHFVRRKGEPDGMCSKCRKVVAAGGGAFNHALSETRKKNADAPDGRRWCAGCQKYRLIKFFRRATDGRCRPCIRQLDHARMVTKTYGITPEQYLAIKEAQGGRCFICTRATGDSKALAVDHDHMCCPPGRSCGKCVRGLLCSVCNRILGHFRDDVSAFLRGADYLVNPPARAVLDGDDDGLR